MGELLHLIPTVCFHGDTESALGIGVAVMTQLRLADSTVADYPSQAQQWYASHLVPSALRNAHPLGLATALSLAGQNVHRLAVDETDGSIYVYNYPVW